MFLMSCTRPDIAYSVSKLSSYTVGVKSNIWVDILNKCEL